MISPAACILPHTSCLIRQGQRICNIGPGLMSDATEAFKRQGLHVTEVDLWRRCKSEADTVIEGEFVDHVLDDKPLYDAIWASHVLEHQVNPGHFLQCARQALRPRGWLFVSVPPLKHDIVGGHVTLWNLGLLMYHLVLARFDVAHGHFTTQGYNCTAFVQRPAELPRLPRLNHDQGDIEKLAHLFPVGMSAAQGFDGRLGSIKWPPGSP